MTFNAQAPRRVTFRTDASTAIGTGHVMRCLTLADALRKTGTWSQFICRNHSGHLADAIRARGYDVHLLPGDHNSVSDRQITHSAWLGASQDEDAAYSTEIIRGGPTDWLVVDHYGLDEQWEQALRPHVGRILAIDDLADRRHDCDLLLDQNLGRTHQEYASLVPSETAILAGTAHALLRPEFAQWRNTSLRRRGWTKAHAVLISLGGTDKDNYTRRSLSLLAASGLQNDAVVTVVLGADSPWIADITAMTKTLPWRVEIIVQSSRMAELMAKADVAIGAAGSTTWERCCLGLPSALWVIAPNQQAIASAVEGAGAAIIFDPAETQAGLAERFDRLLQAPSSLAKMSRSAAALVDGKGVMRVLSQMEVVSARSQ